MSCDALQQAGARIQEIISELDRLKNTLLHILEKCGDVWYTKMNKLLFYTDFLAYREHGMAISGLRAKHRSQQPCPDKVSGHDGATNHTESV